MRERQEIQCRRGDFVLDVQGWQLHVWGVLQHAYGVHDVLRRIQMQRVVQCIRVRRRQPLQWYGEQFVLDVPGLSRHVRGEGHNHSYDMQRVYRRIHLHRDIRQYRVPRRKIPGVYDLLHKLRRRQQIQQ